MRSPFRPGDALVVRPDRLGKRGEAEADHEGWRVRVPGGIPGEDARVTILWVSKGGPVALARFEGPAAAPDPDRREPPCPIHDACGGCGLQHLGEGAALARKIADARRVLADAGGAWEPPIRSPRAFGYRAKTFLLPQARGRRLLFGARPPRGPLLVDTTGCAVLRPEVEALASRVRAGLARRTDLAGRLRAVLLRANRGGETLLTFVHAGPADALALPPPDAWAATAVFLQRHDAPGNLVHGEAEETLLRGHAVTERFAGAIDVVVPPTAFLQANPDVAEDLYDRAARELAGAARIAELYCGAGAAGLLALTRDPTATLRGVDRSPRAVAAAAANAARNGLAGRSAFLAADAASAAGEWDAVLVNPPRTGCHEAVLAAVAASAARRLVYLSCSPSTLARDVARLGWPVRTIVPADMLPQTPHLELLAVLERP